MGEIFMLAVIGWSLLIVWATGFVCLSYLVVVVYGEGSGGVTWSWCDRDGRSVAGNRRSRVVVGDS